MVVRASHLMIVFIHHPSFHQLLVGGNGAWSDLVFWRNLSICREADTITSREGAETRKSAVKYRTDLQHRAIGWKGLQTWSLRSFVDLGLNLIGKNIISLDIKHCIADTCCIITNCGIISSMRGLCTMHESNRTQSVSQCLNHQTPFKLSGPLKRERVRKCTPLDSDMFQFKP